jgi:hypothetical protein
MTMENGTGAETAGTPPAGNNGHDPASANGAASAKVLGTEQGSCNGGDVRANSQQAVSVKGSASGAGPSCSEVLIAEAVIRDAEFMIALNRLKSLSGFLLQCTPVPASDVMNEASLGGLNQLRMARLSGKGRSARGLEWHEVERRTRIIWTALSDTQRRKFAATQIPGWISYLIVSFLVVAASSLVGAYLVQINAIPAPPGGILILFLFWILGLGLIGAAASIGMNALSVQDDATFDISSGKFIWLRLVVGALFGTVLTLPLGFVTFREFLAGLAGPGTRFDLAKAATEASLLLLPFILGFSTSLVILVLNRAIESVQTFFGKSPGERRVHPS